MCLITCGIGGTMINNDSGYKFNPGTMMTHGTSMGLWHPNDWNQWSSWSGGRNYEDWWSSRSQWHSEPKKYFDKSPPPEWDEIIGATIVAH